MRILFISQYFPPEFGAASSRSYDILQQIKKEGHEIFVLSEIPHYPTDEVDEKYKHSFFFRENFKGLNVTRTFVFISKRSTFFQRMMLYFSFVISAIIGSLKIGDIDILVATSPPLTVGLAGLIISKLKRCKFILDIRDLWPESAVALGEIKNSFTISLLRKMELLFYKHADCITITVPGFKDYMKNLGISETKIFDIPNGANLELFYPRENTTDIKKLFGWEGKFLILFSGNHGLAQGLEYILKTSDAMGDYQDILFIFIGDGVVKDKIKKLTKEMNLNQVIFLDKQDREQMPYFISAMDVCLVPLIKHPLFLHALPSKMFEYMACEKPVIISIDGEARRLINEAGSGIFVEPENIPQMKDAILQLYRDRELGKKMGKKGRKLVNESFCRKTLSEKFERILFGLANK